MLTVAGATAHRYELACCLYTLTTKHHQVSSVSVSDLNDLPWILRENIDSKQSKGGWGGR